MSARPLSIALRDPFVIASGVTTATRSVETEVHIQMRGESHCGIGEAAALPAVTREDQPDILASIDAHRSSLCTGDWPLEPSALSARIADLFPNEPVTRTGVETALADALARSRHLSLAAWLSNGRARDFTLTTDITIPILEPEYMGKLAADWRKLGFRHFKLKVGKDRDHDTRALEAIIGQVKDAIFRVDANGGFSASDAIAFAKAMTKLGAPLECYEQPCAAADLDGMAQVAAAVQAPVIADESVRSAADFERLLKCKAADGINLKLAKLGGPIAAYALGMQARALDMPIMMGGMVETRLGMTAAAHVACAIGNVPFIDLDTALLLASDPYEGGYENNGPELRVLEADGIGVVPRAG